MTTLFALHAPAALHLQDVIKYMRKTGPPALHAYWRRNAWWALEGSHRIAAAHKLCVTPQIIPVGLRSTIIHDTIDVYDRKVSSLLTYYDKHDWWVPYEFKELSMPDKTNKDLIDAYSRRFMLHVCKDGTVTYRDKSIGEKVFNGSALPVFSVDTADEAKWIQVRFCKLQYESHPLMPGKPWYKMFPFSGELDDLDRVRSLFAECYKRMKERNATTAPTRKPRKVRKKCA
jgi:hypothetical protein